MAATTAAATVASAAAVFGASSAATPVDPSPPTDDTIPSPPPPSSSRTARGSDGDNDSSSGSGGDEGSNSGSDSDRSSRRNEGDGSDKEDSQDNKHHHHHHHHHHKHKHNVIRNSTAVVTGAAKAATKTATKEVKHAAQSLPLPFVPPPSEHHYTFEELSTIEQKRRQILPWVEEPFWRILSHWNGTVWRDMVRSSLFWITVALYVTVRMQARYGGVPSYVQSLDSGSVGVLGGFLSFFLVLYVNQNLRRYFALYGHSMACKGRIFDVATLARSYLTKATAHRLVRWLNAAHIAGYVGLSKVYPYDTFFVALNREMNFLTPKELERINAIDMDKGGAASRELTAWCLREIYNQQHRERLDLQKQSRRSKHHNNDDNGMSIIMDNELAQQFRDQILQFRAAMGQLSNAADLPIPFYYVHFICLLSVIYLPLFALSAGYKAGTGNDVFWTADIVAGLVVAFQSFFVIGLRIIGQKMSDPYGTDLVDLSVMFYIRFTWTQSNRVLEADLDFPDSPASPEEEHLLTMKSTPIGPAWNTDHSN
eukprot:CAMPEP_0113461350 /NCGR_PEP_ID=MMETSP0014_2-20120614/11491_1 /TAXON_ID=2857 /ORGANISM="Nitzschia sp." /LENGTH=537 /DNA_ID=CAMNT_0000353099 /DNA_START=756 /DNA_END=2366 /DNA_ORIENTATION=+ /assembly_acc=CAM_ASM_000159